MNRKILFRGKRIDNGEWVEGFYTGYSPVCKGAIIETVDDDYLVDPSTIGEFIEKESFYEGDILYGSETNEFGSVTSSWYGEVKYDKSTGRIRVLDEDGDWYETDDYNYDKIAGNIHDNPGLLNYVEKGEQL